jgi:hypothetical protein
MRHPPPRIKKRAGRVEAHGAEPEFNANSQKRANYNAAAKLPSTWNIPPEDHDGLEVGIGSKGEIILTQHRPFMDEAAIALHPTEARAVLVILPDAIAAADRHRKGAN